MEQIKKEVKERVMNVVNKVNDAENYETAWDEKGDYKFKSIVKKRMGSLSRARGARFELKVRDDLKLQGWIVTKWMNNIDFEKDEIVSSKRKYNPLGCFEDEFILFDYLII